MNVDSSINTSEEAVLGEEVINEEANPKAQNFESQNWSNHGGWDTQEGDISSQEKSKMMLRVHVPGDHKEDGLKKASRKRSTLLMPIPTPRHQEILEKGLYSGCSLGYTHGMFI